MKPGFLQVILFLFPLLLFGQKEFRPGQLFTLKMDTIKGTLDFGGDDRNSEMCTFKDSLGTVMVFKPFAIKGYRFNEGKFYISKYVKDEKRVNPYFVEYLVNGRKNLYFIGIHGHPYYPLGC
ncbi:MAG: hypothetical protein WCL00_11540 [Bacteroidota bacterium]